MDNKIYDVIILGGGPAGTAAAVYCARKRLKTLLITKEFGGQSIVSDDIQNWIGEPHISGVELAKKFEEHVRDHEDTVDIKMSEEVTKVGSIECVGEGEHRICDFQVETKSGNKYVGKTVILGIGARRRKLDVPGEKDFEGKGVVYCSTCDAPLFKDKKVAVIGGGNAGMEAVVDLFPYASEIYLLQRSDSLKGDPVTRDKIEKNDKVTVLLNADTKKITGDKMVDGLIYEDKDGNKQELDVGGVFVEIGSIPNSDPVKDLVDIDDHGQVKIDSKHATTSQPGVFAAGDITDDPYKQNNISAGDAVKASLAAYNYLQNIQKQSPAGEGKKQTIS